MQTPVASRILALAMTGLTLASTALADRFIVYVGTYTGPKSEGIYAFRFDNNSGAVEPLGLVAKTVNPTFLALHPGGKFLYAANEVGKWGEKPGGFVTAFSIDAKTGKLAELNQQSAVGDGPCHLVVDDMGRNVLVANYGGGSVAALPLNDDGSLKPHSAFVQHTGSSVNPGRQKEPHAHSVNLTPDNRYAVVADLGTDKLHIYDFDAGSGSLKAHPSLDVTLPPGSGPRHFAFSPDGRRAYVINELLQTLTSLTYDPDSGKLAIVDAISTLPGAKPVPGNSTAEVRVHPNGKFIYGSNRGHDSIVVFAVDAQGKLKVVEHEPTQGKTPRNFNLDPSGRFLWAGNQGTGTITLFRVDAATGELTPTGQKLEAGSPVCIRFQPVK
jgi:6-phosphogluconolactonase